MIPKSKTLKKKGKITLTAPAKTTLYYTLNGKIPTLKSKKVKPGKKKNILISKKTMIKVIAVKKGYANSNVILRVFKLK